MITGKDDILVTLPPQTFYRKFRVFRFDFDANESALLFDGYLTDRARAQKGIENEVGNLRSGKNCRAHKGRGERCKMSLRKCFGIDVPHRTPVPQTTVAIRRSDRFHHCVGVVMVVFRLRKKEHVLMSPRRPVFHRFRLAIGLVPDDIGPKVPSVRLKSEGNLPWNADEIFRLEAGRRRRPIIHSARPIFLIALSPSAAAARVGIAYVQPERAVIPENAPHLSKDFREVIEVEAQFHFRPDLARNTVIAQPPVGRARYTTPKDFGVEQRKRMIRVADDDARAVAPMVERDTEKGGEGEWYPFGPTGLSRSNLRLVGLSLIGLSLAGMKGGT